MPNINRHSFNILQQKFILMENGINMLTFYDQASMLWEKTNRNLISKWTIDVHTKINNELNDVYVIKIAIPSNVIINNWIS